MAAHPVGDVLKIAGHCRALIGTDVMPRTKPEPLGPGRRELGEQARGKLLDGIRVMRGGARSEAKELPMILPLVPGIQAEERGQAEAIARSTEQCLALGVPMVAAIVGEGGSGGAIALAAANRVLMFEHAVYSVISPEGCASILWRTSDKAADAATAMKMSAQDLLGLKVIDHIVPEPVGGAHRAPEVAIRSLGDAIAQELDSLAGLPRETLLTVREEKFLAMGRG